MPIEPKEPLKKTSPAKGPAIIGILTILAVRMARLAIDEMTEREFWYSALGLVALGVFCFVLRRANQPQGQPDTDDRSSR
jgi:hypothetical protein